MSEENATNPEVAAETTAATTEEVAPEANETELSEGEHPESETADQPAEDDTEEVEYEGQKYRVPKPLKSAIMMHADYTRKTQEVAEQRKALEQQRQQFEQYVKVQQEHIKDLARLHALDEQLEQYRNLNWDQIWQQDPTQHSRLIQQFNLLKDARERLVGEITQRDQQRALEAQQELAKRAEESRAYLMREIPEWSAEYDAKLTKFALDAGFQPDEIKGLAVNNPRAVKMLHLAYIGQQLLEKQKAATKPQPQPAQPVPKVGTSRAPATKDPRRMSTEEWMKWRNEQLARKSR
nr:MAG: hypothetical protein DIU57_21390 [Pseudomonadota bacterium]